MRSVLRVLAGLVLVASGVLALAVGAVAWAVGQERTAADGGAFVATLAPVQTDGYAIVVPDVSGVLERHGVARHLGDGRLTITVRSASPTSADQFVIALVPSGDALRYLSGTARTEVRSVGYTTGEQPVSAVNLTGGAPSGAPPWLSTNLEPERVPAAGPVVKVSLDVPIAAAQTLVVRRLDGAPGLAVSMTVGFAPSSWGTVTTVLFVSGLLGMVAGLALLVLRRPWIDPMHPMVLEPEEADVEPEPALVRRRPRGWRTDADEDDYWPINSSVGHDTVESPYVHTAT